MCGVTAVAEHPIDHGAAIPDDPGSDDPDHDDLLDDVDEAEPVAIVAKITLGLVCRLTQRSEQEWIRRI